jgi:hypothetical protein
MYTSTSPYVSSWRTEGQIYLLPRLERRNINIPVNSVCVCWECHFALCRPPFLCAFLYFLPAIQEAVPCQEQQVRIVDAKEDGRMT